MGKYKPTIILTLALTVFLASCKGTSTTPGPTGPTDPPGPSTKSWVVTTFVGDGTQALFSSPRGVAVDSDGNVYVADTSNHRIRKITSAGVVSTFAGGGTPARFIFPQTVAVDSSGNLYVADTENHTIRKIEL